MVTATQSAGTLSQKHSHDMDHTHDPRGQKPPGAAHDSSGGFPYIAADPLRYRQLDY